MIEQENLTLTDEILDQAYKEFAGALNQPEETIRQFHRSDKEAYEIFRQKTLEKHVIKHILENSHVERVETDKEGSEGDQTDSSETETTLPSS